ncbi:hypothetical protein ABPG72_013656 [Tetrahymena utriculariae]
MDYISILLLFKVKDLQQILIQLELKVHIIACGALFIQKIELSTGKIKPWLAQYLNESWIEIYINAFYWSVVTMVTLGYGDIVPVTLSKNFLDQNQKLNL